jgi:hypothetical protein
LQMHSHVNSSDFQMCNSFFRNQAERFCWKFFVKLFSFIGYGTLLFSFLLFFFMVMCSTSQKNRKWRFSEREYKAFPERGLREMEAAETRA